MARTQRGNQKRCASLASGAIRLLRVSGDQLLLAVLSVGLGGGFVTSLTLALKARPEREAVIIVPWQKLNEALQGQNETLRGDLDGLRADWRREREARIEVEKQFDLLEARCDRLERQLMHLNITPDT